MTDGNTYAINKQLDDQEDFDALQEIYADLEQAEARIEELEDTLSLRTNLHQECIHLLQSAEAKLAKAVRALGKLENLTAKDAAIVIATLAELKGQDDG